jgi:protein-disulfide isomerase
LATFLKSAVDLNFMKSCLDSGKYDQRLATDMAIAEPLFPPKGGTPNFFVNNVNFGGAVSWTDMQSTVDAALK